MEITLDNRDKLVYQFITSEQKYSIDGKEVEKSSEILDSVGKELTIDSNI